MSVLSKLKNPKAAIARLAEKYTDYYNNFSYNFYKNGESELLKKFGKTNPQVVFDVGANVGEWAKIVAAEFNQANIHCFELSSATFQNLKKNLSSDRVVFHNLGLSSTEGSVTYKDYGENSGVNTLLLSATYHDENVTPILKDSILRTGDSFCAEYGINSIDFLKVDVEGAEHLVLQGFQEMLKSKTIRLIQFEYGYTNGDSKFLMRDFYNFFQDFGYVVGRVRKNGVLFEKWNYKLNDFKSGPNYVAILSDDIELLNLLSAGRQAH